MAGEDGTNLTQMSRKTCFKTPSSWWQKTRGCGQNAIFGGRFLKSSKWPTGEVRQGRCGEGGMFQWEKWRLWGRTWPTDLWEKQTFLFQKCSGCVTRDRFIVIYLVEDLFAALKNMDLKQPVENWLHPFWIDEIKTSRWWWSCQTITSMSSKSRFVIDGCGCGTDFLKVRAAMSIAKSMHKSRSNSGVTLTSGAKLLTCRATSASPHFDDATVVFNPLRSVPNPYQGRLRYQLWRLVFT